MSISPFPLTLRIPSRVLAEAEPGSPSPSRVSERFSPNPPKKGGGGSWRVPMARTEGLALRGHPVLLHPGPAVQGEATRGQSCALRGQLPEDWRILVLVQPGQLHGQVWPRNLLCRLPAQLEWKSLGVSAPLPTWPPPSLATAFLRRVRSAGPVATCQHKTLRIQQRGGRKGPVGPSGSPGFSVAGELSQTSHLLNGHSATLPCLPNRLQ